MGDLSLYKQYIKMQLKSLFEYRLSAVMGLIAIGLTNISTIVFFWIIFGNIPTLNGWTFGQVLFLTGTWTTAYGLSHTLFPGISVWWVEGLVQHGGLDRMLMNPINILKHLFMYGGMDISAFGDLIVGITVLVISSGMIGINWTVFNLVLYAIFMISSVIILLSFHIIMSTLSFWVVRASPIADVFFSLMKFSEYPIDIFSPVTIFFISVIIPIGFISYYPSQIFIGQGIWMNLAYLTPVVAILMFIIASRFWYFGLKNYTSTGS